MPRIAALNQCTISESSAKITKLSFDRVQSMGESDEEVQ
jgi:hypothetical protein